MAIRLKIRGKILLGFLVMILPMLALSFFSTVQLKKIGRPISQDVPKSIQEITLKSHLDELAQSIMYYDEVLTQSARNYAFTGDKKWEDRYNNSAPQLDAIIKEAIKLGDDQDRAYFATIDEANILLVDMELKSLALVDLGNKDEAVAILESSDYWQQKTVYGDALVKYVDRRKTEHEKSLAATTEDLANLQKASESSITFSITLIWLLLLGATLLAIILGLLNARFITHNLIRLTTQADLYAKGNLETKLDIKTGDEVEDLSRAFNKMAKDISSYQKNMENKVKERTANLERMNSTMVGRELKMMELKKRIKELENKK